MANADIPTYNIVPNHFLINTELLEQQRDSPAAAKAPAFLELYIRKGSAFGRAQASSRNRSFNLYGEWKYRRQKKIEICLTFV